MRSFVRSYIVVVDVHATFYSDAASAAKTITAMPLNSGTGMLLYGRKRFLAVPTSGQSVRPLALEVAWQKAHS